MSFTLSELLQAAYAELGQLAAARVSGGSTDTLVDETMRGRGSDDAWKGGCIFIISAGGEAPQGEFSGISAYDDSEGLFTLASPLTAAVEAGDLYGLASGYYPLGTMIELANAGLRGAGELPLAQIVSLDGCTSAIAWQGRPPVRVDRLCGGGAGQRWQRTYDWEYQRGGAGEDGTIICRRSLAGAAAVRIWYMDTQPRLEAWDDELAEAVVPELAAAAVVERALRWQNSRLGGGDPFLLQRWNDAKVELGHAQRRYPIWGPGRGHRMHLAGAGR